MNRKGKKRINRKNYIVSLSTVFAVILCISVAYAALSSTLNISGSSEVIANSWNVFVRDYYATGNSGVIYPPTITGTSVTGYKKIMSVPGDYGELQIMLGQDGTIPGEISEIIIGTPKCTSSTGNEADAKMVCDNLIYTVSYADGTPVELGDIIDYVEVDTGAEMKHYDIICKKNEEKVSSRYDIMGMLKATNIKRKIILKLEYSKDSVTSVPSSSVTVSGMDLKLVFTQSNDSCIAS